MDFYLLKHQQQLGPYSVDQIQIFMKQRLATTDDLVWAEGWPSWLPIGKVPGLAPFQQGCSEEEKVVATNAKPLAERSLGKTVKQEISLILSITCFVFVLGLVAAMFHFHGETVDRFFSGIIIVPILAIILYLFMRLNPAFNLWRGRSNVELGNNHQMNGEWDLAIKSYDMAIKNYKESDNGAREAAIAYFNRGLAQKAKGVVDKADEDLKRAREFGFTPLLALDSSIAEVMSSQTYIAPPSNDFINAFWDSRSV